MNIWQSIALISPWQAAYAIGLLVLFWVRGPSLVSWVLLADFIAVLAIMAAMDFGWLVRAPGNDQVTAAVLVVWCITAAVLVSQPGVARVLAMFSAIGILTFSATLLFGVQISTTSAIVNALALVQIVVAGIGGNSDDSGNRNRRPDVGRPVSIPVGNQSLAARGEAKSHRILSQGGGGL